MHSDNSRTTDLRAAIAKLQDAVGGPFKGSSHPDRHKLLDWYEYGPTGTEIAELVSQLAYDHGLRLAEIEALLAGTLRKRLSELGATAPET